jgi:hypothetical protein
MKNGDAVHDSERPAMATISMIFVNPDWKPPPLLVANGPYQRGESPEKNNSLSGRMRTLPTWPDTLGRNL